MEDETNPQSFPYAVEDQLSCTMLKTIPKKTCEWLARLNYDLAQPFDFEGLHVESSKLGGAISTSGVDIWWSGPSFVVDGLSVSDERLLNVRDNLTAFIDAEIKIYSILQSYESTLVELVEVEQIQRPAEE